MGERCLDNVKLLCNRVKKHSCCIRYTHKNKAYGMDSTNQEILTERAGKSLLLNTTVDKFSAAAKFGKQRYGSSLSVQELLTVVD